MFSQAKKQVNDTNFYSHYISPWACFFFDNLNYLFFRETLQYMIGVPLTTVKSIYCQWLICEKNFITGSIYFFL